MAPSTDKGHDLPEDEKSNGIFDHDDSVALSSQRLILWNDYMLGWERRKGGKGERVVFVHVFGEGA